MRIWSVISGVMVVLACVIGGGHVVCAMEASLVADTKSGFVIASEHADKPLPPASLTKLMTLYLIFGALDNGIIQMTDQLPISKHAASQPKSKLYVQEGDSISVEKAVLALIIKSANDVAVAVAEALAPNEEQFADLMTRTAQGLGMTQTVFKNASGLHVEGQVTTARDMAILTMALIEHYPQYYDLFATPSFTYQGKNYASHNVVLQQYEGAEGLKTGFVSAVGYNIISTAQKDGTRLVSVVIGEESQLKRDLRAMRLLDKGFQQVAVQKKAELSGQLQAGFNPINRKAFIAQVPKQMYVPVLQAGWRLSQKRLARQIPVPPRKQMAEVAQVLDSSIEQGDTWAIQVGAFEGREKARKTAQKAIQTLGVSDKTIDIPQADNRFFRSRITGFQNKDEAFQACQRLQNRKGWQCFLVSPNKG